jgi:hypothetical protein
MHLLHFGVNTLNLRVNFDREEQKKLEELKKVYGLKQNTELIRFLITKSHKEDVLPNSQK